MRKTLTITFGALLLLLAVFVFVKYELGGYKKPEIAVLRDYNTTIHGKNFFGPLNDKGLEELFKEMESYKQTFDLKEAQVVGYFLTAPSDPSDSAEVFIGLINTDQYPDDTKTKMVNFDNALVAAVGISIGSVPVRIYSEMEDQAENLDLKLSEASLEIYPNQDSLVVIRQILNTQ